jgi:excisionase family DNA binding protein
MNPGDRFLSVKKVAELLSICSRGVWRLVNRGEIPQPVHVGRAARWYESDIQRYMHELRDRGRQ